MLNTKLLGFLEIYYTAHKLSIQDQSKSHGRTKLPYFKWNPLYIIQYFNYLQDSKKKMLSTPHTQS